MTTLRSLVILFTHLLPLATGSSEGVGGLVWKGKQKVHSYWDFSSVAPYRFSMPDGLENATWHFRATKSPADCKEETVTVYMQFGGLPTLHGSFPDNFYLGRIQPVHVDLKSNNISASHTVLFPQAGDWYTAAIIKERDDAITQKGLTEECEYYFTASLEVKAAPMHETLIIGTQKELTIPKDSSTGDGIWVGVTVPPSSLALKLKLSDCSEQPCPLTLSYMNHSSNSTDLMEEEQCMDASVKDSCFLEVPSPLLGMQYFVKLQPSFSAAATVKIIVESEECKPNSTTGNNLACVLTPRLDRYELAPDEDEEESDYNTQYVRLRNSRVEKNIVTISNSSVTVIPFDIERTSDIGGTLHLQIAFNRQKVVSHYQKVRVCGALYHNQFPPLVDYYDPCEHRDNGIYTNTSNKVSEEGLVTGKLYVPFPEEGTWLLALALQCYDFQGGHAVVANCQHGRVDTTLTAKIEACVDRECGQRGKCRTYIRSSDFIVFSSCSCAANWKGYGCTDGREAKSDKLQLLEVLLLTVSNAFFIPAIILAIRRRYYLEAVVYFYNMFFSAFYHACDGDRINKYLYCMTDYYVLAICDFWGSTISLWATLVAMAQLPENLNEAMQMGAPLALIVGILLDRHSLWVIVIPFGVGLLLVGISWAVKCSKNKECYPGKRRVLFMLPGGVIAGAGAIAFAFFQTKENYMYVHSCWHIALSLSIIFLLPPRRKNKVKRSANFEETESTEGLMLGPNGYCRRLNFDL